MAMNRRSYEQPEELERLRGVRILIGLVTLTFILTVAGIWWFV